MNFSRRLFNAIATFIIFAGILSTPSILRAQTAKVSGSVVDSSGAAVVGANVTATNTATSNSRSTVSTDTGAYTISTLPPGVYVFSFSKAGFKALKFDHVNLTVDQVLTLDAKLEVGAVSATIEVAAASEAPIDTQTATLSNVVEHTQMTELPLILRDPYQLVLLGPGVTQSDGMGGVSVNGGRERNNNFLLDGADNNDADVPGPLGGLAAENPDATQEFRVLTNNFAPEYGRNNGAIIDVVTKSGTNDFHGNTYYFGRWDALGARDYFNHQIDPVTGLVAAKNPYVRNLYGGSLGGPIKKDRTFFFVNYQGDRFVTTLTNTTTVPTAAFKSGIFTYTNPVTGVSQAINVTTPGVGNNGTSVGLDPVAQQIFAFYPTPNVVNSDGITGQLFFPSESREKDEDAVIKVDQKINQNNNLYARYTYNYFDDPNPFHNDFLPGGLGTVSETNKIQGLAFGVTSTFGSSFVNEFRFGFNRINEFFGCGGIPTFDSLGYIDGEGRGADFTLPDFQGGQGGSFGFGCQALGDANGQSSKQGTYQWYDGMSKIVKSHTFKWGVEFRDVYSNNYTDFVSRGTFTFNIFTASGISPLQNLNTGVDTNLLEDTVGALLGLVNSQTQTQFFNSQFDRTPNDELNFKQHEVGLYWQDSWKAKSNLTITYGLRWEWYGVPYEKNAELSNLFQDSSGPAPFTFQPVGPGTGFQLFNNYYKNFEPRFGFAWDPFKDGRTSVRGGIGVFSDRIYGNLVSDARGNPPFQPSVFNQTTAVLGTVPAAQLQAQAAFGNFTPSPIVNQGDGIFPDLFDPNIKPPLVTTWNIGVQRSLTESLTVDANYVGNHATRILRVIDGNPPQPNLVSDLLGLGVAPETLQFANLYFGAESGVIPFDAVNNNAFFDTFTDQTSGHSWYDGLQIQVTERNYHGLQIQGSYTWAHALDDSSDPLFPTVANGNFPVDSFNLRREKGNSGFDTRQRGVINFVYQPNIGRGRGHLTEGFAGRALEGWQISGIAAWQTGLPYDIFGTADTLHTNFADRVTVVDVAALKTVPASGRVIPSTGVFTGYNLAAFNPDDPSVMPVPFGVESNLLRNQFTGPGINNWDVSLAKTTAINERFTLQLRFEFYNLFNRTQFAKPDANIQDALFGYSSSQVGQNDGTTGARQVQIGAKLNF
jgi:Carboxypeptidase regulatory-like domain